MISVICPVYNEIEHIENILRFFVESEPAEKELLVIDGRSTDGTRELVEKWSMLYPDILLINNPDRFVAHGLNKAIPLCRGDLIIRIDGHCDYDPEYFKMIIDTFRTVEADIVGGPMRTTGMTDFQNAVGYASSTIFGVGGSRFHNINYRGYSDHVFLGAWHRHIFEELKLFDERLTVDHDEDFSYRAAAKNKKIFINPEIKCRYYPRNTPGSLLKQYFRYGFEKPMVMLNNPGQIKWRHIIPSLFTVYLVLISFFTEQYFFVPLVLYLLLNLFFSLKNPGITIQKIYTFCAFPVMHISYGVGVIAGMFNILQPAPHYKSPVWSIQEDKNTPGILG